MGSSHLPRNSPYLIPHPLLLTSASKGTPGIEPVKLIGCNYRVVPSTRAPLHFTQALYFTYLLLVSLPPSYIYI